MTVVGGKEPGALCNGGGGPYNPPREGEAISIIYTENPQIISHTALLAA
jgi:hypothetical protein